MNLLAIRSSRRPTAVATRLRPAAITAALGCTPLLLAKEPGEVSHILIGTTLITAFGVGFTIDDSAAGTLEASPTTRRIRMATRLALLLAILAIGAAVQYGIASEEAAGVSIRCAHGWCNTRRSLH